MTPGIAAREASAMAPSCAIFIKIYAWAIATIPCCRRAISLAARLQAACPWSSMVSRTSLAEAALTDAEGAAANS